MNRDCDERDRKASSDGAGDRNLFFAGDNNARFL